MIKIKQYRCTLKAERTIRVAEPSCENYDSARAVVLAWFRSMRPVGEHMIVVGLDSRLAVLGVVEISRGGAHGCAITPADALRPVIVMGASRFIVAHNHPSEDPCPSPDDVAVTRALRDAARVCGLELLDHVVVAVRSGETKSVMDRI